MVNFIVCAVAILIFWNIFSNVSDRINSTATVYQLSCSEYRTDIFSCDDKSVYKKTFKVFPEQQKVIQKFAWLAELENCVVMDNKNWRCTSKEGNVTSLEDGKYYNSFNSSSIEGGGITVHAYQIGMIQYYIRYVVRMF